MAESNSLTGAPIGVDTDRSPDPHAVTFDTAPLTSLANLLGRRAGAAWVHGSLTAIGAMSKVSDQ